ncbi:hypothetical protein NQD34_001477 [Periophthalmus magnuspinnatus]|nr:hypothetical protein NQD34_001477 [Periophthalmus magnuspinnatus]
MFFIFVVFIALQMEFLNVTSQQDGLQVILVLLWARSRNLSPVLRGEHSDPKEDNWNCAKSFFILQTNVDSPLTLRQHQKSLYTFITYPEMLHSGAVVLPVEAARQRHLQPNFFRTVFI